jgi:hypothetical protein
MSFQVISKGGSIGSHGPSVRGEHPTIEEAREHAKRLTKQLTPGERSYYGMGYTVKEKRDSAKVLPVKTAKDAVVPQDRDTAAAYVQNRVHATKAQAVNALSNAPDNQDWQRKAEWAIEFLKSHAEDVLPVKTAKDVGPTGAIAGAKKHVENLLAAYYDREDRAALAPGGIKRAQCILDEMWDEYREAEVNYRALVKKSKAKDSEVLPIQAPGHPYVDSPRTPGRCVECGGRKGSHGSGSAKDVFPVQVTPSRKASDQGYSAPNSMSSKSDRFQAGRRVYSAASGAEGILEAMGPNASVDVRVNGRLERWDLNKTHAMDGLAEERRRELAAGSAKEDGMEAYGVKGMKSTPWRKVFKSQSAFEKWMDANEGDVEVHGTRSVGDVLPIPTRRSKDAEVTTKYATKPAAQRQVTSVALRTPEAVASAYRPRSSEEVRHGLGKDAETPTTCPFCHKKVKADEDSWMEPHKDKSGQICLGGKGNSGMVHDAKHRGPGERSAANDAAQEIYDEHLGFSKLKAKLSHEKGVEDPGALAASIGRRKYGASGMVQRSAVARDYSGAAQKPLYKAKLAWHDRRFGDCIDAAHDAIMAGADGEDLRAAQAYLVGSKRMGAVKTKVKDRELLPV